MFTVKKKNIKKNNKESNKHFITPKNLENILKLFLKYSRRNDATFGARVSRNKTYYRGGTNRRRTKKRLKVSMKR